MDVPESTVNISQDLTHLGLPLRPTVETGSHESEVKLVYIIKSRPKTFKKGNKMK